MGLKEVLQGSSVHVIDCRTDDTDRVRAKANVLDTLVKSSARLCEADMSSMVRPQGRKFAFVANYRFPQAFVDRVTGTPGIGGKGTIAGRVLAEGRTVHIPDVLADSRYSFNRAEVPDFPDWLEAFVLTKHAIRVQDESAEGYYDAAEKLLNRLGYT